MSTDLSHTLHSTIDGEPAGVPTAFDMARVRSRARRRRVARTATRGAVGVGAAGAVALGAVHVARGTTDRAPLVPAVAGAPAGTCGSDATALADLPPDGTLRLGAEHDGVVSLSSAQEDLDEPATRVVGSTVTLHADLATSGSPTPFLRVLAVRDGVVVGASTVGTDPVRPPADPEVPWSSATPLTVDLTTCDVPGHPGGDLLPAGDYTLWAARDAGPLTAGVSTVAGPWALRVADRTPVSGLPADFPEEVGLVPGRLVTARHEADGSWVVEVAVDADDRIQEAAVALGLEPVVGSTTPRVVGTKLDRWAVLARSSELDGVGTVLYFVRPLTS